MEQKKQRSKPDKIDKELAATFFKDGNKEKTSKKKVTKVIKKTPITSFIKKQSTPVEPPKAKFSPLMIAGSIVLLLFILFLVLIKQGFFTFRNNAAPKSTYTIPTTVNKTDNKAPEKISGPKELLLFDFEKNTDGWDIPGWALDKEDHVASSVNCTRKIASHGKGSLEIHTEFTGKRWNAAIIDIQHYIDLSPFDMISVDVYLPEGIIPTFKGKIILTVGDGWKFIEMSRSIRLLPGEWTTISANISKGSTDWRLRYLDNTFKTDIRKLAIRVESNKADYSGPIYVDNLRVYRNKE